jgi:predicted nucleic acid-binding protein
VSHAKADTVRNEFDTRVRAGEIATCEMVKLELLWTTRDHAKFVELRDTLEPLRSAATGERVWRRATDVFEALAELGPLHHRQVGIPDLLIAAAAELAELTVLHYDRNFELIAEVTGQPVRALAPIGSLG